MFNLNELLKNLDLPKIYENQEDTYVKEILDEIENFLKEESEKQEYIEENLRSK
jgi:ribosome assembly protein YihI (activator of Der GTPase)